MKIIRTVLRDGFEYWFYCPGCRCGHAFTVGVSGLKNQNWTFDKDKVTFSPSLRSYYTHPKTKAEITTCHLHVTNGRIEFCGDCPHDHNNKTVDLPHFPENYGLPEPHEVVVA